MFLLRRGEYILMGYNKKKEAWEIAGGKLEDSDESVKDGALRELLEETGRKPSSMTFHDYIDTKDDCLVMLFSGEVAVPYNEKIVGLEQPNPESHKYTEWKWFRVRDGADELPDRITWLTAETLRKVLGIYATSKSLPCPFTPKKSKAVPA